MTDIPLELEKKGVSRKYSWEKVTLLTLSFYGEKGDSVISNKQYRVI